MARLRIFISRSRTLKDRTVSASDPRRSRRGSRRARLYPGDLPSQRDAHRRVQRDGQLGQLVARRSHDARSSLGTTAQPLRCLISDSEGDTIMDREHVKGAADKAKGTIKEGAGKLTGDKDMETEGKLDKAKGAAHNAAGNVKDAGRDAADAIKK